MSSYFDLDRSGQLYIASFCNYLQNPNLSEFNFFKVNQQVIANNIIEYLRNVLATRPEQLESLEKSFRYDLASKRREEEAKLARENDAKLQRRRKLFGDNDKQVKDACKMGAGLKKKTDEEPPKKPEPEPPLDLLLHEQINARLFQQKLKRGGVVLSLWEIFTLFEHMNMRLAKVFQEPVRYHHILYEHFHTLMTGNDYRATIEKVLTDKEVKKQEDEANGKGRKKRRHRTRHDDEGMALASSLNESLNSAASGSDSDYSVDPNRNKVFKQLKHIFDIKVKELRNMPILQKFIRDSKECEQATWGKSDDDLKREGSVEGSVDEPSERNAHTDYIQNVAVKYSFPLDEDEVFESDFIRKLKHVEPVHLKATDVTSAEAVASSKAASDAGFDFSVSMNTVHTYLLNKEDTIQSLLVQPSPFATSNTHTQQ